MAWRFCAKDRDGGGAKLELREVWMLMSGIEPSMTTANGFPAPMWKNSFDFMTGAPNTNSDTSLIPYFEELLSLAESCHLQTRRHLNVYGDIGELFGAITYGLKLYKANAQGADGRNGNDPVEIKTITLRRT
ncbi:hypothetical protein [Rhizobium sp. CNPSo 3490]|uniref:hypothetical protein n=1 Tax=Rhizobium sp. CNPSo 3490 TaxID=3021407 RepID=UPI00254B2731|nr:hypothetical protein [Rhizobium sp. CNPSo 3490]MDK4732071.1 hypothetical protein [Rhizobium sp. CNPSo 3490]